MFKRSNVSSKSKKPETVDHSTETVENSLKNDCSCPNYSLKQSPKPITTEDATKCAENVLELETTNIQKSASEGNAVKQVDKSLTVGFGQTSSKFFWKKTQLKPNFDTERSIEDKGSSSTTTPVSTTGQYSSSTMYDPKKKVIDVHSFTDGKGKKFNSLTKDQRIKLLHEELSRRVEENIELESEICDLKKEIEKLRIEIQKVKLHELEKQKRRRVQGAIVEPKNEHIEQLQTSLVRHKKNDDSMEFLHGIFSKSPYFKHLDNRQTNEIVECCYFMEVNEGDVLFEEGADEDCLFIVNEGIFKVKKGESDMGNLIKGSVIGESSLLYMCQRYFTCTCISPKSSLWKLERVTYQKIMLKSHLMLEKDYLKLLRNVPLLSKISDFSLLSVMNVVQETSYEKNQFIYERGQVGNCFFIIKSGSVNLCRGQNQLKQDRVVIKKLGIGSCFGERALMNYEVRAFDAIAGEKGCIVISIENEDLLNLVNDEEENFRNASNYERGEGLPGNTSFSSRVQNTLSSKDTSNWSTLNESKPIKPQKTNASTPIMAEGADITNIKIDDLRILITRNSERNYRVDLVNLKSNPRVKFTLKQVKKWALKENNKQDRVLMERKLLLQNNCPFLIRLHRTFKDRKYVYLLFEPCVGGDLLSLLCRIGRFEDRFTKFYAGCVIEAFEYLHKIDIVFRNFKLENAYIASNGYVKLSDLTYMKRIPYSGKTWSFVGDPEYTSPEVILNKGYDYAVDYWCLGVFIYHLTIGEPPFTGTDSMKTYNLILKGFEHTVFPYYVTRYCNSIIKKLCKVNPSDRLGYHRGGWNEVRKAKWFDGFDWQKLIKCDLCPPFLPDLLAKVETSSKHAIIDDDEIPLDDPTGWDKDF